MRRPLSPATRPARTPGRARAAALPLLVTVLSLVLTACVSLPDSGPVRTRPGQEQVEQGDAPFDFTPSAPRPGSAPLDIVEDFLLAMQASPQSTAVAREYLTDEGQARWSPGKATLVYGSRVVTDGRRTFNVRFDQAVQLDDRGTWLGEVNDGRGVEFDLRLVRERGQWRIANPPDALLIPESHFESRFQQFFVYFFDPTAQVLVPEPVHLPRGEQAPTLLVRRLLRGPDPDLAGVLRTFIPGGTRYVLSVAVSPSGMADVPLSAEVLELSIEDLQMAVAQIAWTLRQVPGIESMRVTVDGSPLDVLGQGGQQSVNAWTELDPSIHWASQELFGIREGRVLALSTNGTDEAVGQFGAQEYSLRDISVDLPAERLAAVTEDGTTVVLAPRTRAAGEAPPPDSTQVVYSGGTDLLRPAWDFLGQLWLVDRRRGGAALSVVREGAVARVRAPGLTGQDVKSLLVSRDGTRVVAVVADPAGDRLLTARVRRGEGGRVLALTPATEIALGDTEVDEIRDVAWRTPGTLAVLTGPTAASSQVLLCRVDGSTAAGAEESAEVFRDRADRLVGSPSPGTPTYIANGQGDLYELSSDGQWVGAGLEGPLFAPTFVG